VDTIEFTSILRNCLSNMFTLKLNKLNSTDCKIDFHWNVILVDWHITLVVVVITLYTTVAMSMSLKSFILCHIHNARERI